VLPRESLFGEQQQAAKASVVLQLRRSVLPPEQVEAIRSLVAGAVENLSPADVTLVDADGRLNLAAATQGAVNGDAERALEEKLVSVLEPTVGSGNVHATVNVVYDPGSEEKTDEIYDPTLTAPLTTHKTEQSTAAKTLAAGVPGTASNTPGAAAPGSVQATAPAAEKATTATPVPPLMQTAAGTAQNTAALPVYPQNGGQSGGQTMTEETNSYAVTRHLLHTEEGPGRIRRVTAAVVVNDRMSTEGAGKLAHPVWKRRTPEEMQRLEQLTHAAVGFDATRGDQVVIENIGFSSNEPEASPAGVEKVMDETSAALESQPALIKILSVAGMGLLVVMVVLRPMTRQMTAALSQSPASALLSEPQAGGTGNAAAQSRAKAFGTGTVPSLASLVAARRPSDAQDIYEHISEQIRREPAQSTRLLESWINAPAEEED
jgi:flagellar M-ring protein FliF